MSEQEFQGLIAKFSFLLAVGMKTNDPPNEVSRGWFWHLWEHDRQYAEMFDYFLSLLEEEGLIRFNEDGERILLVEQPTEEVPL